MRRLFFFTFFMIPSSTSKQRRTLTLKNVHQKNITAVISGVLYDMGLTKSNFKYDSVPKSHILKSQLQDLLRVGLDSVMHICALINTLGCTDYIQWNVAHLDSFEYDKFHLFHFRITVCWHYDEVNFHINIHKIHLVRGRYWLSFVGPASD